MQDAAGPAGEAECATDAPHRAQEAIEHDLYCPQCGYNLRSLVSDRCPECGRDVSIIRERKTQIPWIYREKDGTFRAYWKTVLMVMFRSGLFCLETSRPVDLRHARRFRWVTALHAYLPLALLSVVVFLIMPIPLTLESGSYAAVIHLGIIACLAVTTTLPYYAIYHRDVPLHLQHRAAVLALYASAPLAWMFVVALLEIAGLILSNTAHGMLELICYMAAVFVFASLPVIMLVDLHRLIKRMLQEPRAVFRITVKLTAVWFGAVVLTLFGIPLVAAFLALVYYSLQ